MMLWGIACLFHSAMFILDTVSDDISAYGDLYSYQKKRFEYVSENIKEQIGADVAKLYAKPREFFRYYTQRSMQKCMLLFHARRKKTYTSGVVYSVFFCLVMLYLKAVCLNQRGRLGGRSVK